MFKRLAAEMRRDTEKKKAFLSSVSSVISVVNSDIGGD